MKLQLTTLAAAVTFALSTSAFAQTPKTTTSTTSNTNLTSVDWGVDNGNVNVTEDDTAWGTGPTPSFTSAQNAFNSLNGNAPTSSVTGNNNSSVSTQTGDYNQASIVQTMSRNESQLKQSGSRLKADIQQLGSRNYSDVDQNLTRGGVVNSLQGGSFNDSRVSQYGGRNNMADISQSGSGDRNNSVVRQGGINGDASNNDARVTQTGNNNDSYIGQTYGDGNYADVMQAGTNGESYVIQRGDNNIAFVNQTDGANDSYIMQDNYGNGAGSGRGHYADVSQGGGSNNVSTITQLGLNATAAAGNAYVTQHGTGNQASVLQY